MIDAFYDEQLQKLGFKVIYAKRDIVTDFAPQSHTIAVAYKPSDWVLIDYEVHDIGNVRNWFPSAPEFSKAKKAMFCLLQNQKTKSKVVLGNTHFEHNPNYDHVKFAQAVMFIELAAKYCRDNNTFGSDSLPFISGGDFNSQPISSVLSAFYNEDIESYQADDLSPSVWRIPADFEEDRKNKYKQINQMLQNKINNGLMDPLMDKLVSAY